MKYLLIFACFLYLSLTGCRDYGTEGGNPKHSNGSYAGTASGQIVKGLCEKRISCLGVNSDSCTAELYTQVEVTNELRINPPYRNLNELAIAEIKNEVLVQQQNFEACQNSIKNLECNDPLAQEAFDSLFFDKIHILLRASNTCSEIFSTL
jgi:hypothetical protein